MTAPEERGRRKGRDGRVSDGSRPKLISDSMIAKSLRVGGEPGTPFRCAHEPARSETCRIDGGPGQYLICWRALSFPNQRATSRCGELAFSLSYGPAETRDSKLATSCSPRVLPHPYRTRNRDALRMFHGDPAMTVLPPGVPVGRSRLAPVATRIHGSQLSTAEIDQPR